MAFLSNDDVFLVSIVFSVPDQLGGGETIQTYIYST